MAFQERHVLTLFDEFWFCLSRELKDKGGADVLSKAFEAEGGK